MKYRASAIALMVACSALALTGCKSDDKKASTNGAAADTASMAVKADNAKCPIAGEPVNAKAPVVAYKDKHVGFCCPGCAGKFAKMTDAEKDAALAKSMK